MPPVLVEVRVRPSVLSSKDKKVLVDGISMAVWGPLRFDGDKSVPSNIVVMMEGGSPFDRNCAPVFIRISVPPYDELIRNKKFRKEQIVELIRKLIPNGVEFCVWLDFVERTISRG